MDDIVGGGLCYCFEVLLVWNGELWSFLEEVVNLIEVMLAGEG